MKILLVSATKFEIFSFLKTGKGVSTNKGVLQCRFGRHSVDVLITGVGMTATAFQLGRSLHKKYDLAINAGVAGSFRKDIALGDVVNVVSDVFADLGAEDGERFLTLKEMGLSQVQSLNPDSYRGQVPPKGVLRTSSKLNSLRALKRVNGITVNKVHGNAASIKKAAKKFGPDVESMEGAAFFFACNEFKTPCVQIRAISNFVERRNKKKWKLDLAVKNLNVFLEVLLNSI